MDSVKMDKDRIAELRLLERHLRASGQMAGAVIGELLDALEAALARLEAALVEAEAVRDHCHRSIEPAAKVALLRIRLDEANSRIAEMHGWCATKEAIAKLAVAARDRAIAEADGARIGAEELAVLREVVRLVAEARERYDKRPRGAGGQRMPDEIDDLLCRLYEMGAHPASRVLGDGCVVVDEEELVALRCLDDAVTINGDGMSTEALGVDWEVARSAKRRLVNIRAAKGGAT